jgi:parallel beta-helix repeat protein
MKRLFSYFKVIGLLGPIFFFVGAKTFVQSLPGLSTRINNAKPGDTIYVENGTYTDVSVEVKKKFTQNVVVRPRALGKVIFTGAIAFRLNNTSNIKFMGFVFKQTSGSVFQFNNCSNIEITNNYFYQCGINPNHSVIRIVNGSHDNKIDYNTFEDTRSQAILIGTYANKPDDKFNTGNKIFRNHFCNVQSVTTLYPKMGRNGLEQIVIGFLPDYFLKTDVYQNLFENIYGDGWEIISNKSSNNTIRENTFLNNKSGVSIRSGSNVKVVDNYLDNTDKGIRIFGNGHTISNNYILNSDVGIRLPSADFETGAKAVYTGYYQQDNILITDNFIINPKSSDILIGENHRKLQPKDIRMTGNKIYYTDKKQVLNTAGNISMKSATGNQYLFIQNLSDTRGLQDAWFSKISDANKLKPFITNDSRVGKTW